MEEVLVGKKVGEVIISEVDDKRHVKVFNMSKIIKEDLAKNDTILINYAIGTFKNRIKAAKTKSEFKKLIEDMELYHDALIEAAIPSTIGDERIKKYATMVDGLINICTELEDKNE